MTRVRDTKKLLDGISSNRGDLRVVPICRRRLRLYDEPDTLHLPHVPRSHKGALRDRHERWARDAVDAKVATDERG